MVKNELHEKKNIRSKRNAKEQKQTHKTKDERDQKKKEKTIATNSNKQQMFYENKMDYIFMWMFVSREWNAVSGSAVRVTR